MIVNKITSKIVDKENLVEEVTKYDKLNVLISISKKTINGAIHAIGGGMKDTYLITIYSRKENGNV